LLCLSSIAAPFKHCHAFQALRLSSIAAPFKHCHAFQALRLSSIATPFKAWAMKTSLQWALAQLV
jgi:hypothetical protein